MLRIALLSLLAGAVVATTVFPAMAASAKVPSVIAVIFEQEHTRALGNGALLEYRFQRTVSDERLLGPAYSDEIKVGIKGDLAAGNRVVDLAVYTGERARQFSYPDLTINPVINFFLEQSVRNFSQIAGGDTLYLKGRFKAALRDTATVEPIEVDYDGRKVSGYRVAVRPYAGDQMAHRMQGYDGSTFQLTVSEHVPGQVVDLVSIYTSSQKEAPRLEERISFAGLKGAK